jgi:adenylate cyclase
MHAMFSGTHTQRLRIASGLILFAFALTHFLNHALGLVSLEVMVAVQDWRQTLTRSVPGTVLLVGAAAVHIGFGLYRLSQRTSLRMPLWELMQIALGLAIPLLLISHIVYTRIADNFYGIDDAYPGVLQRLWPDLAIWQILLLLIVWVHGLIGLHFWLRLARWYRRVAPLALALAVAIPLLAVAGFTVAARQAEATNTTAPAGDDYGRPGKAAPSAVAGTPSTKQIADRALMAFAGLVGLALAAIGTRMLMRQLSHRILVSYVGGPEILANTGPTLLEISRIGGIPHTSICGGRARCSTCRVRVLAGRESLPPIGEAEASTLKRINAASDIRLACQLRPTAALKVVRLVSPGEQSLDRALTGQPEAHGVERICTVLFLDIRGFTGLSQAKLPYDVVFLLNQLFAHIGAAIQEEGGWIDKYLGDGLLAVFGRDVDVSIACRQALRAARAIDIALDEANRHIATETKQPVQIGIGIHTGPLILGQIGHRDSAALTVIGRTVNAAARLEQATKEERCQLIVSVETFNLAALPHDGFPQKLLVVRGLDEPLNAVLIARARDLRNDIKLLNDPMALSNASMFGAGTA